MNRTVAAFAIATLAAVSPFADNASASTADADACVLKTVEGKAKAAFKSIEPFLSDNADAFYRVSGQELEGIKDDCAEKSGPAVSREMAERKEIVVERVTLDTVRIRP